MQKMQFIIYGRNATTMNNYISDAHPFGKLDLTP